MSARAAVMVALGALLLAGALGALIMDNGEEPDEAYSFKYPYSYMSLVLGYPVQGVLPSTALSGGTYSSTNILPGLTVNPATGEISGVPSRASPEDSSETFTIRVTNGTNTYSYTMKCDVFDYPIAYYAIAGNSFTTGRIVYNQTSSYVNIINSYHKVIPGLDDTLDTAVTADGYTLMNGSENGLTARKATQTIGYSSSSSTKVYAILVNGTPAQADRTDIFLLYVEFNNAGWEFLVLPVVVVTDSQLSYAGQLTTTGYTSSANVTARPGSYVNLPFTTDAVVKSCTMRTPSSYMSTSVSASTLGPEDPECWDGMSAMLYTYAGKGVNGVDILVNGGAAHSGTTYDYVLTLSVGPAFSPSYTLQNTVTGSANLTAYLTLLERVIKASQDSYDFYVTASGASYDPLTVSADYSGATWAVSSGEGGFSLSSSGEVTPSASPVSAGEYGSQVACTSPSDPTNVATVPLTAHVVPDLVFGGDPNADGVAYMTSN